MWNLQEWAKSSQGQMGGKVKEDLFETFSKTTSLNDFTYVLAKMHLI